MHLIWAPENPYSYPRLPTFHFFKGSSGPKIHSTRDSCASWIRVAEARFTLALPVFRVELHLLNGWLLHLLNSMVSLCGGKLPSHHSEDGVGQGLSRELTTSPPGTCAMQKSFSVISVSERWLAPTSVPNVSSPGRQLHSRRLCFSWSLTF